MFWSPASSKSATKGVIFQTSARMIGTQAAVEWMNQTYATLLTNFVLHCNRVGFEDGLDFSGGSTVFGPDGELVAQAPYFEESLLVATLDLGALRRERIKSPLLRDERPDLLYRELRRMVKSGE